MMTFVKNILKKQPGNTGVPLFCYLFWNWPFIFKENTERQQKIETTFLGEEDFLVGGKRKKRMGNLYSELCEHHQEYYYRYIFMSPDRFKLLLNQVDSLITR